MGQVCTNPLEYLISEYGEDVGKFIVVEKTKEFFNEKYPEVKKNLNVQTTNFQKDIIQKVDEQSSSCITKITTNINELKESKKTEIATFEKTSNKNVDDFIGIK
jgi:IMP dehydrogenase/GMP reductase